MERVAYDAEGLRAFNDHVRAELGSWWTKKYLAHWLPRIRFGLWLVRNCYVITKCVAQREEQLRAEAHA
jgi:hypothetical protein